MSERRNLAVMAVTVVVVFAVIIAGFAYISTTDDPTTGTLVINDGRGENVTIPKYPQRIVSLGSSFTEALFTIGAGDQVVGVDKYSDYPEEALNKTNVGSWYSADAEAVMALEPDLIVTWSFATDTISALEGLDIPVLAYYPGSISEIMEVIQSLGNATGHQEEATDVVDDMQSTVDYVKETVQDLSEEEKPKVYFELRNGKSVGPGSISDELIKLAGGINIYGDNSSTYPQPSPEYVIDNNPDFIIIEDASEKTNSDIVNQSGWEVIDAVQEDNIYRINGDTVSSNPRVVDALYQIALWLHPSLF